MTHPRCGMTISLPVPRRTPRAIAAAAVALMLASPSTGAAAESPRANGGCRDGVPNGAFELTLPDGRLRVSGAFARGKRSGTFIFWSPSGARLAVVPYDEDAKSGTVAAWHPPAAAGAAPVRRLEAPYAGNLPHGTRRTWHANGNPRTEVRYERGSPVEARAWAEAGAPLPAEEASALAERDLAGDDAFLAALEALVDGERPRCDRVRDRAGAL